MLRVETEELDGALICRLEGRFVGEGAEQVRALVTRCDSNLQLVVDLGVRWQEKTGLPLPLGGNVVRRDLGPELMRRISDLLKRSILYALDHRQEALQHALKYARDMDVSLADKFVGMYVNDWTLDYGPRGREAVRRLLEEGHKAGIIPSPTKLEFVGD